MWQNSQDAAAIEPVIFLTKCSRLGPGSHLPAPGKELAPRPEPGARAGS